MFVLGGSAAWISHTVHELQSKNCHPIIVSELPEYSFVGRYSCVKTDYNRVMSFLSSYFMRNGKRRTAFYGMNHASFSDMARKSAFYSCFSDGEIFENNGSLEKCFADFYERHRISSFDSVICANDFAAVSLLAHLRQSGVPTKDICIAVHSNAQILTYFPEILALSVDYSAVATAAFEIADCISANPNFMGMRVTVDCRSDLLPDGASVSASAAPAFLTADTIYDDGELGELMRIDRLLSESDETDIKIIRLLSDGTDNICESTFLSDNGVKYRIKKMKRICGVESKKEIPVLLAKYGIVV